MTHFAPRVGWFRRHAGQALLLLAVTAAIVIAGRTTEACAAPVSTITVVVSWDASPAPDVAGYVVYWGPQPDLFTDSRDVGNTTSVELDVPDGVPLYFAVHAYNVNGIRSAFSEVRSLDPGGAELTIVNPGNQEHAEGTTVSLQIQATGPAPLQYVATGLPDGLSIDAATGLIAGTIDSSAVTSGDSEVFGVQITVQGAGGVDALTNFSWVVLDAPTASSPPVITHPADRVDSEGHSVDVQIVATDPDGDALTYAATNLPLGLSIDAGTGRIGGTIAYTAGGEGAQLYVVTVTVSDGSHAVSDTFEWRVIDVNAAPSIEDPGDQQSNIGDAINLQLVASDPDGDRLFYWAWGLPSHLHIDARTGEIRGTLRRHSIGKHLVTVFVSDGRRQDKAFFKWTVVDPNKPPVVTNPGRQENRTGDRISLTIAATDPNGDELSFRAYELPLGLKIDRNTGKIEGTLSRKSAGYHRVRIVVSDGSLTAETSFTWKVILRNDPPTITNPGNQSTRKDQNVSLKIVASDPDHDEIHFATTGLPRGLWIDEHSGRITGRPTRPGTFNVTVSVTDGKLSSKVSFAWEVTDPNAAPVVATPGSQSNRRNQNVSVRIVASDPDHDEIHFAAAGLPSGLWIDEHSGRIAGKASKTGTYNITVSVTDGRLTSKVTFSWVIAS